MTSASFPRTPMAKAKTENKGGAEVAAGGKPQSLRKLVAQHGHVTVTVASFEDLPEHGELNRNIDRGVILCQHEGNWYEDVVEITDGTKPANADEYHASDDGEGPGFPLIAKVQPAKE